MTSLHTHQPFTLTGEQVAHLSAMSPVAFEYELQRLAQGHHYRAYPLLGVWDSLSGRPQMRDWFAHQETYLADARAVFEAGVASGRAFERKVA